MINRKHILFGIEDKDEKNLISLICDKADKAITTGAAMYSRFLSPAQAHLVNERFCNDVTVSFSGGYDEAERTVACITSFDTYETYFDYPIEVVRIKAKNKAVFSHRDYLGSLMALGIKRELVGDIVICESCAYLFCHREICDFITLNLTSIGRNNVISEVVQPDEITLPKRQFKEKSVTVSSMRLDCILSAATGKSRAVSAEMITKGLVQVNYEIAKSGSVQIDNDATISVRGFGKMIISANGILTKKGRYHINIKQYI